MQRLRPLFLCLFLIVSGASSVHAGNKLRVFVSILPQQTFVKKIGKELVDVQVMVQPGASPTTYEPKPRQMVSLAKTQLYFAMGVPFEKVWLNKISASNLKIKLVHTDHGIKKMAMTKHHHRGEEPDQQTRKILDPHIWLSPKRVKQQAKNILEALSEEDPIHKTDYTTHYFEFIAEIEKLDRELRSVFLNQQGRRFLVFHPSWGYFAQDYGLQQIAIEVEGKSPKPAVLKEIIEEAKEEKISVIFVQPQFSTKSARLIAREIRGRIAFADPLAEDWARNLRSVAQAFGATLK